MEEKEAAFDMSRDPRHFPRRLIPLLMN